MKLRVVTVAATLLSVSQLWAQNPSNPIQIALQRWYQVNTATLVQMQSSCTAPGSMVFDATQVWVACSGDLEEYNAVDTAFIRKVTLSDLGYLLGRVTALW
jgi:hypothetical protein